MLTILLMMTSMIKLYVRNCDTVHTSQSLNLAKVLYEKEYAWSHQKGERVVLVRLWCYSYVKIISNKLANLESIIKLHFIFICKYLTIQT